MQSVFAIAVALRGRLAITASSPKISPAFTTPKNLFLIIRPTSPSSSRYILAPLENRPPDFSFSAKIGLPAGFCSTVPVARKNSSARAGLYTELGADAGAEKFSLSAMIEGQFYIVSRATPLFRAYTGLGYGLVKLI